MSLTLKTHQLLEKSKLWIDKNLNKSESFNRYGQKKPIFDLSNFQMKTAYAIVGTGAIGLSLIVGSALTPKDMSDNIFGIGGLLLTVGVPIEMAIGGISLFFGYKINEFIEKISFKNLDASKSFLLDGTLLAVPLGSSEPILVPRLELAENIHLGILDKKYSAIYSKGNEKYSSEDLKTLNIESLFKISFNMTEEQKDEKSTYNSNLQTEMFHRNKLIETTGDVALSHLIELQKLKNDNSPNLPKYGCKETFIDRIKNSLSSTFNKDTNSENKFKI